MSYETLNVKTGDGLFTITVERPKALNALNRSVLEELGRALDAFEAAEDSRVCVITGAGEKAFVAGADIAEMSKMNPLEARAFSRLGQDVFSRMENIDKPVVAAVNGFALGGGCELVLACDLVYASESARFGQPEINLGLIPGFGGTQRLPKTIGLRRAKEWIYSGEMIDAKKAFEIGLVNAVFPAGDLLKEVEAIAEKLAEKPILALGLAKRSMHGGFALDLETGSRMERDAFGLIFTTEDRQEGMQAFLEKRKPSFQGK